MAKPVVLVTFDRVRQVSEGLRSLGSQRVMVGIPSEKTDRKPDPKDPHHFTNAAIGYVNETGAPEINLPARPHLVPGTRGVQKQSIAMMREATLAAMDGKPVQVTRILTKLGLFNVNAVRAFIRAGNFVPLSPRTLAGRRARGRKGTAPLMDTGQYVKAITFVIRRLNGFLGSWK